MRRDAAASLAPGVRPAQVRPGPPRLEGDPWPSSRSASSATRSCASRAIEVDHFDKELRSARRRPHRHHARRPRCRPGRAPDRGRPAGLHLERRRRGRPPGQPVAWSSPTRPRTAPRAACRCPGSTYDCLRALSGGRAPASTCTASRCRIEGSELLARAIQHETDHLDGILFLDRLDPEARKAAMREIRESEWFGLSSPGQGQPARHPRAGPDDARRLRRHPRGRRCPRSTPSRRAATSSSAWSPGPTPRPVAAASSSPARWRSAPRSSAYRC